MPLVEKRYAEALFKVSFDNNAIDKIREEFDLLIDSVGDQIENRKFWDYPGLKSVDKKNVIKNVLADNFSPYLVNLAMILIDKKRIHILKGVYKEFVKLVDSMKNYLSVKVTTPWELTEEQIEKISEKYKVVYRVEKVNIENVVDKEIIGGIKIQIGDKVEDFTFRTQLEVLRNRMKNAN